MPIGFIRYVSIFFIFQFLISPSFGILYAFFAYFLF